jgi:glycosyltransferase involved in cell wall biosynthesis
VKFTTVIVGDGDDKPRLEALAAKLELADSVRFTGFIPESEKVNWYRRAAVLVENSVKEGWGLIVMEANACGTSVVVARSPGLVDSSRDGVNGLMYDYGDVPALAEKLERLLTDEALRARLGQQAIEWARQWTWDGATDAMERAIEETMNEALSDRGR